MHIRLVLLALLPSLATSCNTIDCATGTTERNGSCVPASETIGTAKCGAGTELRGDSCAPKITPAVCDPSTTTEVPDPSGSGVVTCLGTGGGGCAAKLPCPAPADGKHTICGQIYDLETNEPYVQPGATGAKCTGALSGPCALGLRAYDAVAFAMNPGTTPLTTDPIYIDDCGRYRVPEIPVPTAGLVALGLDDSMQGPGGLTNAVGVATAVVANKATTDLETFVARKSMTDGWTSAGTPSIATGFYVPLFRGHRTGLDPVAGVTVTYGPMNTPPPTLTDANRQFYFVPDSAARVSLKAGATVTGINGTALFSGATLTEIYSGQGGGLPATCRWDIHGGASTPGVVFVQVFRPISVPGQTCTL